MEDQDEEDEALPMVEEEAIGRLMMKVTNFFCSYCGRTNHKDDYLGKNNSIQCHYCKRYGHAEKICFKKAKEEANLHEEKTNEQSLFLSSLPTQTITCNMLGILIVDAATT